MFQRMASSFDESSTAGVFLPVLFSENSRCELLFPSHMTLLQSRPSYSPPPPQRVPASPFMGKNHFPSHNDVSWLLSTALFTLVLPKCVSFVELFLSKNAELKFLCCVCASRTSACPGEKRHLPLAAGLLLHKLEPWAGERIILIVYISVMKPFHILQMNWQSQHQLIFTSSGVTNDEGTYYIMAT